jgi:multidrug efflux system membrane fusion protein
VRSATIGSEVPGRVTSKRVEAGDSVRAGQVLLQIDQRVAEQQAAAVRARLAVAEADFNRQRQLYEKGFLSKAANERAEAEYKAARAEAAAAGTRTGLYTLTAPYAGRIAEVSAELGDMVTAGQPLIRMYDPAALRVSAHLPQSQAVLLTRGQTRIDIPGAPEGYKRLESREFQRLPAADPRSQTVEVRVALTVAPGVLSPGSFARVMLPALAAVRRPRITVPVGAIVQRSELTAVYVVTSGGVARLRQIRTGRTFGDRIEVHAGLEYGERIALDPLVAARHP